MNIGTQATLLPLIQQGKIRALAGHHRDPRPEPSRRADHDRKAASRS